MKTLLLAATIGASQPSAAQLQHELERLVETTRVLYVAAHPDDENTQLLAYLAGARHVRATYLSLTRGGGGQNRIGDEQGEMLAVLRTEELLAARRVDGAEQRFTGARDFGYSKSPEETLRVWGHDAVLGDVVRVVRELRPHVILTRFPEQGSTHGHHLASARLAREAFEAAGDPGRFPEHLEHEGLSPWQPTRVLWDVPHFMDVPDDGRPEVALDIGGYDPLRGRSYGELAAESRSRHRSQAFGTAPRHGPHETRLRLVAGDAPERDPLDGIESEWGGSEAGAAVRRALEQARERFDPRAPERSVAPLVDAYRLLEGVQDPWLRAWKGPQLLRVIAGCAGLRLVARADEGRVVPGGGVEVALEAHSRRAAGLTLRRVELGAQAFDVDEELAPQRVWTHETTLEIAEDAPITAPPWLAQPGTTGRYEGAEPALVSSPRAPAPHRASFLLRHGDVELRLQAPVEHRWTDPVRGERTAPLLTAPAATVTPETDVQVVPAGQEREVRLTVRAARPGVQGTLRLDAPDGWRVQPSRIPLDFADGGEREVRFTVAPGAGAGAGTTTAVFERGDAAWSWSEQALRYEHVPPRTVLRPARLRLVPLDVRLPQGPVGFIPGAGDRVAQHLVQLGLEVTRLEPEQLDAAALEGLVAVVVGVRAWSARPALAAKAELLMDYVEGGGTLLIQYDKAPRGGTRRLPIEPLELSIGRDRVTDESAAVELLQPEHPALTTPHRIGAEDFEGWVQERGLYFADSWGDGLTPLLSMADPYEQPVRGALVVGRHGRGHVVYTGLSLFRQLPAGVPGAYRLTANLLSLGDPNVARSAAEEEGPPLGQWRHWYLAVAMVLLALVGLLYWITKRFT